MRITALFLLLTLSAPAFSAEAPTEIDPQTLATLKAFMVSFEARLKKIEGAHEIDNQFKTIATELNALSKQLPDAQLPAVEQFALSKDGASQRWWFAYLLADRGQFDAAAHLFIEELRLRKEQRAYAMWKYWQSYYGDRKDLTPLSIKISIAFVHQFEIGNAEYKHVVAELFDKGDAEAAMSLDDFKKSIQYDRLLAHNSKE